MNASETREIIIQELPEILKENLELQLLVRRLFREEFAGKAETESRFDQLLAELRQEREARDRKWAANEDKWQEQVRLWRENDKKWEEQTRLWRENEDKWQEQVRLWRENDKRWEEQTRLWRENEEKWQEQNRKWHENQEQIRSILTEIKDMRRRHDSSIGALGARWGLQSEAAFRDGLKAILEDSFPVEVLRVLEFDEQGEVFGRPEQVEIDLIVQNGLLIACEIKSSMSKPDVYAFDRKVAFYERLRQRPITRRMIISPMVHPQAAEIAQKLGIEVYSYPGDAAL